MHRDTNNEYDPKGFHINGFNINKLHRDTNNEYDPNGFDIKKLHKYTSLRYEPNGFNINGIHKDTNNEYDPNGFDINKIHKDTKNKYNLNGFNIYRLHKDTNEIYNPNGFDINKLHKDTNKKYDKDGFDINGINKDTGTFFNKKNYIRKDISKNINWLKDKNEFLKLYNDIIKNGEFTETANKKVISSKIFKDFVEDILNGKINNNNKKEIYEKRFDDVEKKLTKSKKSEKVFELKNYLTKIKNSVYRKDKDKIRTDKARSFKDQGGKGYVNLPILLSKTYSNNSSKELTNNIKNLLNHLHHTK